jgi:hypothetical protein
MALLVELELEMPPFAPLARGVAASAAVMARRGAAEDAAPLARLARRGTRAALVADARVLPALAAAICSCHAADDADAEAAMWFHLATCSPFGEATRELQDSLVRLGVLEAVVRRLSAGGSCGQAAALLMGCLVEDRPDVAAADVTAGALPSLVALRGGDEPAASLGVLALRRLVRPGGSTIAAAAVDAGAVRAAAELLGRSGLSAASLTVVLRLLLQLSQTPAGAGRLVTDGALPHVVRLLRSPARGVAGDALACLAAATTSQSWGAVAEALLADATAAPALSALLLGPDGDAPFGAACVLGMAIDGALTTRSPEALRRAGGLAAAARRAGAVPRLVELRHATLEGEHSVNMMDPVGALAMMCLVDAAAAREALGAGARPAACRALVQQDARGDGADEALLALSLAVLVELIPHLRDGAPRPAAAAEPGLVAALSRTLGRVASRAPLGSPGPLGLDPPLRLWPARRRRSWRKCCRAPTGPSTPPSSSRREVQATW